jgi:hypothetical protein
VAAGRQARSDARDQTELAEVADTDLSPPGNACYGVTHIVGHPRIGRRLARAVGSPGWLTWSIVSHDIRPTTTTSVHDHDISQ